MECCSEEEVDDSRDVSSRREMLAGTGRQPIFSLLLLMMTLKTLLWCPWDTALLSNINEVHFTLVLICHKCNYKVLVKEPLYYSWPLANSVTFHIYDHDTISIAPYFVRRFPYAGDSWRNQFIYCHGQGRKKFLFGNLHVSACQLKLSFIVDGNDWYSRDISPQETRTCCI